MQGHPIIATTRASFRDSAGRLFLRAAARAPTTLSRARGVVAEQDAREISPLGAQNEDDARTKRRRREIRDGERERPQNRKTDGTGEKIDGRVGIDYARTERRKTEERKRENTVTRGGLPTYSCVSLALTFACP